MKIQKFRTSSPNQFARWLAATGLAFATGAATLAQDDATRLKKLENAVSQLQQENAELKNAIRTGEIISHSQSAASKISISDSVTELKFYGDGQLRYGVQEGEAAGLDSGDHGQRDRLRYRLHLGVEAKFLDNWLLGVQLETSNDGRSTQVTAGDNPFFSKSTVGTTSALSSITTTSGPFVTGVNVKTGKIITGKAITGETAGKGTVVSNVNFGDSLFVSKLYLKYSPADWLSLEGGKIPNPFITTPMIWDPDLNPEGLAEQLKFTIGPDRSSVHGVTFDLFANFAQFIYDDAGYQNSFNNTTKTPFSQVPNKSDNWMLGWQLGARAHFPNNAYLQVAPTLYNYTGGGQTSATTFNGDSPMIVLTKNSVPALVTFNQTGTNNLAIFDIPAEFGWDIGGIPFTIFGDFADNLDSGTRASRAGHPDKRDQGIAYQVGASIGKIKRKSDWELKAYWQHSEQYSVDPNLVDNNVFDGRLNSEGFVISLAYAFADASTLTLTYSHGEQIDRDIGTAGYGSLVGGSVSLQNSQYVFADFQLKF